MSEPYKHADYVRNLVDTFPPLTTEQRARLSILLRGGVPQTTEVVGADEAA